MISSVYDKTDKGRDEIATRQCRLPARVRTLLVLVDGRRDQAALLRNVAGLGLDQQHIEELLAGEFISVVPAMATAAVDPAVETPVSARARALAKQAARAAAPSPALAPIEAAPLAVRLDRDTAEQLRQLYEFYNRSSKAALGLRSVMFQLKVEKAIGVDGLRDLRTPFLRAVIKAKGGAVALAMRDQLDGLLGGAPADDDVVMPSADEPARGAFDFFNMSSGAIEY